MKKQVVLYPVLFAAYPILFLFSKNHQNYDYTVLVRPLAIVLIPTLAAWYLLARWLNNRVHAALLVSIALLATSSFGVIHDAALQTGFKFDASRIARLELIVLGCLVATALATIYFFKRRTDLGPWSYFLNLVGMILIIFPLVQILQLGFATAKARQSLPQRGYHSLYEPMKLDGVVKPDIYFIILDSYARHDILEEIYGYDNSEMYEYLRNSGFQVLDGSTSNYPMTVISLAATLNLHYLEELVGNGIESLDDWRFARDLVRNSYVVNTLRDNGYSIVAFSSLYYNVDFGQADVYLTESWFLNYFEISLIGMTPLPWSLRKLGMPILYDHHRSHVRYVLDGLPETARISGPKFVYAHLFPPHPPFVFGPNGEDVTPDRRYSWADGFMFTSEEGGTEQEYKEGYLRQVKFLNTRFKEIIREILAKSATPPIIILQSDHGPAAGLKVLDVSHPSNKERFGILNALYLPGASDTDLPRNLSAVNTFRMVFNRYFGTNYDMLENRSYIIGHPYHYMQVTADLSTRIPRQM